MEDLIVKYTKMIHPIDLGEETSRLENILRILVLEVEIEIIKRNLKSIENK